MPPLSWGCDGGGGVGESGIFDKNHELTPLKKCKFFDYSEMSLLSSKKTHFEKTTSSDNKA